MATITVSIHRGGGGVLNYLLAASFALVSAQSAWAANGTWIDGASGNTADSTVWVNGTTPNAKGANNVTFNNTGDTVSYVTNNISQSFSGSYFGDVTIKQGNFEFAKSTTVRSNNIYPGSGIDNATVNVVNRNNWYAHYVFRLGQNSGTKVSFTNEGGAITEIGRTRNDAGVNVFSVANANGSEVDFTMNGGEVSVDVGRVAIGAAAGATGRVTMNGGSLKTGNNSSYAGGDFHIGALGTGTLTVNNGGTVSVAGTKWMRVGFNDGSNGTLTLNDGTVSCNDTLSIGNDTNSTGLVVVNGGTITANDGSYVGYSGNGTLTVNGGTVEVRATVNVADSAGSQGTINLNGGTFVVRSIYGGSGTASLVFNGGTLKANANDRALIRETMPVTVGEGGGTIDNNGLNVLIAAALSGTGGMTFKGGGTTTLTNGNTYAGATVVELGTTVCVAAPGDIPGTVTAAIPAPAPAEGVYTLATITGESVFSSSVLAATPPANCTLRLSGDNKSVLCIYGDPQNTWIGGAEGSLGDDAKWSLGFVPTTGDSCVIGNAATAAVLTNPEGSAFAPTSITFPADSAEVTISGEAISGIAAITNLSSVSHTINAPVHFTSGINVKQDAVAHDTINNSHVTLAGGAYAASGKTIDAGYSVAVFGKYYFANRSDSPWTATEEGDSRKAVAANSYLYVPYAGDMNNLYVTSGAKMEIGDISHGVSSGRLSWRNYGEMVVTNMTFTGSGDRFVSAHQTDAVGTFKFESVKNSMSGYWFYLADSSDACRHVFYIGAGGMYFSDYSGTPCFSIGRDSNGNTETVRPWYSDFTIGDRSNGQYSLVFHRNVEFCTDDENGTGRTITIDARTRGNGDNVNVTVSGSGMLKVNNTCYNATQPTVTVTNTATLAIKPGASLGTGATTVHSGATLAVEESDAVTISGATTLDGGAVLSFNFTSIDAAPKFVFSNTATASGTAKVKVSAAAGVFPRKLDRRWLIAEGVSGEFELDEETKPIWADGVSVEGSNLYLDVKAPGLSLSVR